MAARYNRWLWLASNDIHALNYARGPAGPCRGGEPCGVGGIWRRFDGVARPAPAVKVCSLRCVALRIVTIVLT